MNPWSVLEIKQTHDKKEIKKAYAKVLKKYHPEDDPDGFMKVRSAYEQALRISDYIQDYSFDQPLLKSEDSIESIDSTEMYYETRISDTDVPESSDNIYNEYENGVEHIDSTELYCDTDADKYRDSDDLYFEFEDFIEPQGHTEEACFNKILMFYNDIFKRRDVKEWQNLFLELPIDEYQDFYNQACFFFNENCNLPHNVWKYLDQEFSLCNNTFFKWTDFVKYDFDLSFNFFDQSINCDIGQYIELRFLAFQHLKKFEYLNSIKTAVEAKKIYSYDLSIYRMMGYSYYTLRDYNNAIASLTKALYKNANDISSLTNRGFAYIKNTEYKLAKKDFELVLKLDKNNQDALKGLVICLYNLKKYRKANKKKLHLYKTGKIDVEIDILQKNRLPFIPINNSVKTVFSIIIGIFGVLILLGLAVSNPLILVIIIIYNLFKRGR